MRGVLLALVVAFALAGFVPAKAMAAAAGSTTPTIAATTGAPVFALQVPDKKIDINVSSGQGGGRFGGRAVWIAIGSVAAVVVLLLIVLAARGGGGTTIVKD